MPLHTLPAPRLRLTVDPQALGFASTAELRDQPLPWIGQERAEAAARFGLAMDQPGYNLFVLGDIGSGRTSLLRQAMKAAAADRPAPPDLCYLHDFDRPERPRALRLPAGQGLQLREGMAEAMRGLLADIPRRLEGADFKAEAERIDRTWEASEAQAYTELDAFAEARQFSLTRENGNMVFSLLGEQGRLLTEAEARALPRERRAQIDQAEQELRAEISRVLERTRPLERQRDEAVANLRRQFIKPLVEHALQDIRQGLRKQIKDAVKLGNWLDQVQQHILKNLDLFEPPTAAEGADSSDDADHKADLEDLLLPCHVNLAVNNSERHGAPVIVEDNPQLRTLFGSIEHPGGEDAGPADFSCVHAGSLLQAHGGYLMLHLQDLTTEEQLWARLRRFLRSGRLQIEDVAAAQGPSSPVALQPEAVDVDVKLVLVGSVDEYYLLQEADPDLARRFRVKVDFAESFVASSATHHATAIFVAHTCQARGLPHFDAPAVARVIEQTHREADDQHRQSAQFAQTEALVTEAAAMARQRGATLVTAADVDTALAARVLRHGYPEDSLHESITEGERLIALDGAALGQLNGMTQIDTGDYRFGFPVRITARTFAGHEGLLNIEREVDMSGPIHDKGVLILHSYLTALFSDQAPLALDASIVFEQEYSGVEGDSASCAELYALLSSLSGLPLPQGIAVTGALNQHGEVLPVGGVNEKIEGWFRACATAGLTGQQGVLIPQRNERHLMLSPAVVEAVQAGRFQVHTVAHVREGIELLTGHPSGMDGAPPHEDSVLARVGRTLRDYRRLCQAAARPRGRALPRR